MRYYILTARESIKRRLEEHFVIYALSENKKNKIKKLFNILSSNKMELFKANEENDVIKFILTLKLSSKTPHLIQCLEIFDLQELKNVDDADINQYYNILISNTQRLLSSFENFQNNFPKSTVNSKLKSQIRKVKNVHKLLETEKDKLEKKYISFEYKIIAN